MRVPLLLAALFLLAAFPSSEVAAQSGRSAPPPQIVVQPQVLPIGSLRKIAHPPHPAICEGYSGCWGFSNGDKEYAAVACATGIWIVEVDPVSGTMTEADYRWRTMDPLDIPMGSTPWRDLVVYETLQGRQFVFSVSDTVVTTGTQFHPGLHVVEVTNLSQGTTTEHVVYTASWERAHTISLDEERGHLHISGAIASGVAYYCIVDVSMFDPSAPPPVIRAVGNSHASFIRADRTYVSDLATDVFVYDIPPLLQSGSFPIPSGQLHLTQPNSHSSWVTEDASLCVAAFEATAGGLLAFTLPSPTSSLPFAGFQSTAGCPSGHTPHYAYGIGRCLYVAHYTDGFHFLELGATAGSGFRSIAKYDTCAVGCPAGLPDVPVLGNPALCGPYATGTTFAYYQGAWDVYPYQDSGVVYVTDTTSGLWALRIPTGHFHRTELGYANLAVTPIPDVQPDGAAPRQGATSFAFA